MKARLGMLSLLLMLVVMSALAYQPRSKVSRVLADMRSMAVAIESYFIDHNVYPESTFAPDWQFERHAVTTPVAYITQEPVDPFKAYVQVPRSHPVLKTIGWVILAWVLAFSTIALFLWMSTAKRPSKGMGDFLKSSLAGSLIIITLMAFFYPLPGWDTRNYRNIPNPDFEGQPLGFDYATTVDGSWIVRSVGPDGDRDLIELDQFTTMEVAPCAFDPTNGAGSDGDIFRSQFGGTWWAQ